MGAYTFLCWMRCFPACREGQRYRLLTQLAQDGRRAGGPLCPTILQWPGVKAAWLYYWWQCRRSVRWAPCGPSAAEKSVSG